MKDTQARKLVKLEDVSNSSHWCLQSGIVESQLLGLMKGNGHTSIQKYFVWCIHKAHFNLNFVNSWHLFYEKKVCNGHFILLIVYWLFFMVIWFLMVVVMLLYSKSSLIWVVKWSVGTLRCHAVTGVLTAISFVFVIILPALFFFSFVS